MKVTKNMLNKELQSSYWALKISSGLLMNRVGVKLLNSNSARSKGKNIGGLQCEEKIITGSDGKQPIRIRIFKPLHYEGQLPGMLYIHGGGLMLGTPEDYMPVIKNFIEASPCIVIAPDYRKALDAPYPAAFNDCYDTLLWIDNNARELGIIPNKLIVAGHSAGGGIAAAVTQKAADTKDVTIAFQLPIYPMLDDRQVTESASNNNAPSWNSRSNNMGWAAYLRTLKEEGTEIPVYAAAARANDLSKLPPTISFVGDVEPFRDETITYIEKLKKAGIPVRFKLFKGCYHAFEILFPKLEISKEAWAFVLDAYSNYIDKYIYKK